jgi:flagellar protein FliO/FliZ
MFDTVFGIAMSPAAKFMIAFVVVLGLIFAAAWMLRRFGTGRLGPQRDRRQPRLSITEYGPRLDARRQLVLVRRDNVEHLLMIGGPTDVVVEPNIVRAVAAPRDLPGTRPPAGLESLPRAIPLPENGGSWPLQPEPAGNSRPSSRVEPLPDELPARSFQPTAEPPRPQRDTLAALADELSTRQPVSRRSFGRPQPEEPVQDKYQDKHPERHPEPLQDLHQDLHHTDDDHHEARIEPHIEPPVEPRIEPRAEPRAEPRLEPRPEPRIEPRAEPRHEPRKPIMPPAPVTAAPMAAAAPAASEADQSLADMAQRLEAALRKPNAPAEARNAPTPPRPAPAFEPTKEAASPPPRPPRPSPPKPAPAPSADAKPNQSKTALYDSLEQEMANLLGRQNKT